MNTEIAILTARAALPRSERGTTIAFATRYLTGKTLVAQIGNRKVQGILSSVDATAHGLVVFLNVNGRSESAPLAAIEIA